MRAIGIDISEHDGNLNFEKIKENFDFVILCCGFGKNCKKQDDSMFFSNAAQCNKLSIPIGIYIYSYAQNTADAKSEAEHILRLAEKLNPLYGLWYCAEDLSLPMDKNIFTQNCRAFLNKLERRGYYAGIRSTYNILSSRLNAKCLSRYDKWVVQHNNSCHYSEPYGIWQFTDQGKIPSHFGTYNISNAYFNYPAVNRISQLPPISR